MVKNRSNLELWAPDATRSERQLINCQLEKEARQLHMRRRASYREADLDRTAPGFGDR